LLQLVILAEALADHPNTQLEITGFTDNIGSISDNIKLSRKRAESVAKELIKNGVRPEQIIIKFEGENNPISSNSNELGRQKNRRVELKLVIK
jgi:outer membrane protein OmpA-like peptidoglycan-associated protein